MQRTHGQPGLRDIRSTFRTKSLIAAADDQSSTAINCRWPRPSRPQQDAHAWAKFIRGRR
ncbi:MAG TPA: hypothetical protein DIT89_00090 [Planctomycetaceae bacterium]|nr:hypothetical protein [Planctomycetaceae bacterium]